MDREIIKAKASKGVMVTNMIRKPCGELSQEETHNLLTFIKDLFVEIHQEASKPERR